MKKIPKGYKVKVKGDEGAFQLAGEIIRSLLLDIKSPTHYNRDMRISRINRVKQERRDFALCGGNKLIQSWCDISGYSYSRTIDKILEFNKIT